MRTDNPATWFRLYAEFATDPKVQMLSESDQRRFIMVLCLRCRNGDVTLLDTEVAFQLRVSEDEWASTKDTLVSKNLIDDDNKPVAWEKRQFSSDSSSERVARHRAKKKTISNCDVTLQKRQVDTETETEKKPSDTDVSLVASNADDVKQEVGQASDIPDCPHQEILNLYADALPELPQPRSWDGSRAENLRRRWRWVLTAKRRNDGGRYATDKDSGLLFFRRLFGYVNGSDFLMGRSGGWTGCDLGWIVKAENFEKILAGNYENRATA